MTAQATTGFRLVRILGAALLGASLLSGCASVNPATSAADNDPEFVAWLVDLGDDIEADPKYNRMPIDTAAQGDEFEIRAHQAFRGEITKTQFADWLTATYPGHAYEVAFVTHRLPS